MNLLTINSLCRTECAPDSANEDCEDIMDTSKKTLFAFLFFPLSYIYVSYLDTSGYVTKILLGIFTVLFLFFVEIMCNERERHKESLFFLCCILVITIAYCFETGMVWNLSQKSLFLHLFAIYYVVVRTDSLCEGETSHMFAWDGLTGMIIMPFGNFIMGAETIGKTVSGSKKHSSKKIAVTILGIVAGLILFFAALSFLKDSDSNYAAMLDFLTFDISLGEVIFKVILSCLVGSYLFGMVGGLLAEDKSTLCNRGDKVKCFISKLSKISPIVWIGFIGLFSVFYVLFFALQGSYMIDALAMRLPEQYTFSEYAVRGFEEMCAVMVINFALLWLTMRTSETKGKSLKTSGIVLMVESLIFALIAFLKLIMYIEAYGLTPLRIQSTWLVLVLSFACCLVMVSMLTGRKTAKIWFIGSSATLALLTLF